MYYHLGAYEDSLSYALGAGDLFDVNGHSEYAETIIGNLLVKHVLVLHNFCIVKKQLTPVSQMEVGCSRIWGLNPNPGRWDTP
mgnify:FL=1